MSDLDSYVPGEAAGAEVQKDGDKWTLLVVRELRHPPALVWQALTDPAHLSQWAPFDADRSLAGRRAGEAFDRRRADAAGLREQGDPGRGAAASWNTTGAGRSSAGSSSRWGAGRA